ncbi:sugar-binding protein [Paenibacillus sp. SI8]|uniref:sugar-binding protein n=1 Tax=unclassified Paenibacillus TaxID=185978 RepID=UPI003464EF6F
MSKPKWYWNWGLSLLFITFVCLLLLFIDSTFRMKDLASPPKASQVKENTNRRVFLISQELDNPYWRTLEQGAQEASERYGMQLTYEGPSRINPSEQTRLLEKALAAKADAIVLQGVNEQQYQTLIHKAALQGVPVVAVDTDDPASDRLTYVGTDNVEAGKQMGGLVANSMGSGGNIGVLVGSEQAENQQQRLEGFRSVIRKYPQLAIVDVKSSAISRLQAARQAEAMLEQYPQIRIMIGFSALDAPGIMEAAQRIRPGEVQIFAFDDVSETLEGIQNGQIASAIVQHPYDMGFKAISLLHDYFLGNTPQPQNYTDITVIDRSSLGTPTGGLIPAPASKAEYMKESSP